MIKGKFERAIHLANHKFSSQYIQLLLTFFISILCGLAWYLLLFGRYPLYFSHVNWIYKTGGDVFQHQIGWEWFRQEPWQFPIGHIGAYGYPFGTSITFTDSIPLFAIPLKLISHFLGQKFQYLGLWGLVSIIAQFFFGMQVLGEFTRSYLYKILGSSILVLSPPFIFRFFYHDSLTAQWILLAAIWLIFLEYRHKLWRGAWIVIFAIGILIHPYFITMLIPLWAISLFFRLKREKKLRGLVFDILAGFGVILLVGYGIGLFGLGSGEFAASGNYSWNLNGFINSGGFSAVLKALPLGTEKQYEGFSYLGLGNLMILPIALFLYLQKEHPHRQQFFLLPFIFTSILLGVFALSYHAFLNTQSLWVIENPKFILSVYSIFRSCGRFIWPVFYLLVLFGLLSVVRNLRHAAPLLLLALIIQLIDIQPLYSLKKFNGFIGFKSKLEEEFWQAAAKTNSHLVLIPAKDVFTFYEPFALYARQNKMTLNWGYFARGNFKAIENLGDQVWADLKENRADKQTIYIFWGPEWIKLAKEYFADHMLLCNVDGYDIALSIENLLIQANFDLSPYCTFP